MNPYRQVSEGRGSIDGGDVPRVNHSLLLPGQSSPSHPRTPSLPLHTPWPTVPLSLISISSRPSHSSSSTHIIPRSSPIIINVDVLRVVQSLERPTHDRIQHPRFEVNHDRAWDVRLVVRRVEEDVLPVLRCARVLGPFFKGTVAGDAVLGAELGPEFAADWVEGNASAGGLKAGVAPSERGEVRTLVTRLSC